MENEISNIIIREALHIHKALGPGLLENVYKECLGHRLQQCGLDVRKEVPMPVYFDGFKMDCGYRIDLIIENIVLIEIKRVEELADIHKAQVLTYLRLSGIKLGLLINFNELYLKEGIKRIVNGL
ncbi:GxxExxY protein [Flavihumibacter rivuli]|uniref:GxxExxY protein n=1 Tax=Flavihumibacter rivuli TaxID=2838156 RepID=UPI001BDE043F|nr:GxxExxY protein [Flavihumibacter rivuli]ULQ58349.1 GxxExxY protein [Flavihumibacter rivuli]